MSKKLFDFCCGNPPYMESGTNNNMQPVYNLFMDEAYKVSDAVELITPARFLFDAGQTPKAWNRKMLEDKHFKVLHYEADGTKVFPNTDIKGGVAITYRNELCDYGEIGIFTEYDELNSILRKITSKPYDCFSDIITGAVPYRYTDVLKKEVEGITELAGASFDVRTNAFERLNEIIYFDDIPHNNREYVKMFGLLKLKRTYKWICREYISVPDNFSKYKLFAPKAGNAGLFGELFPTCVVGHPNEGHTQSFVSIGSLESEEEAENVYRYLKTKFCRALLGILKRTPDITPSKFKYVPLQNFTPASDIDWSKSIHEIDLQLYRKYGLSKDEIDFIETNVKEMV